jgi:hypothetical protein
MRAPVTLCYVPAKPPVLDRVIDFVSGPLLALSSVGFVTSIACGWLA